MAEPESSATLAELIDARRRLLREAGLELDALAPCVDVIRARATLPLAALTELEPADAALDRSLAARLCLDGGLLDVLTSAQLERALGLYLDGPDGPVIGGSWALSPALAEHVALRPLALGGSAPALGFGLPGGLPLAGISASGFAVISQALRPATLGHGLPGAALLRELLAAPRLDDVRALIESTALADGRNWMLADGASYFGYEHLHHRALLTRVGRKVGHVHANNCFDPSLRQREGRPRSALSFRRLELASTLYVQRQPASAAALLEFFTEVETEAFAEPAQRAGCALAIELTTGRALWRSRLDGPVTSTTFATPLASPPATESSP